MTLDPWQEVVLRAAMGERQDGRWSTPQVALSAPRQNGKSQLIVARALAGALLFDEKLIIISAHQQDTARETFSKINDQIESSPALSSRVSKVMNALNREFIQFTNGATIRFKARTGPGGRGFSSDCLLLDEAQILGAAAWQAIVPTMSARPNPQVWLLGTPPTPGDDSEVFTRIRRTALDGKSTRLAYLEWSAELGADPSVESTRASANPAWYTRVNHDIVQGEFESMSPEQFSLERLGQWASDSTANPLIPDDIWRSLIVPESPSEGIRSYGVKFSVDGSAVALAVAIKPESGPVHVEVIGRESMSGGTDWLVKALVKVWREAAVIVIDGKAGAGPLVNSLHAEGVQSRVIVTPNLDQVISAHAFILEAIETEGLSHFDQAGLNDSISCADKRDIGKAGGWGWKSIRPDGEVLRLDAVTLAHYGAMTSKRKRGRSGEGRIGVVL